MPAPPAQLPPQPLQAWKKNVRRNVQARQRVGFQFFCLEDSTLKDDDSDPFFYGKLSGEVCSLLMPMAKIIGFERKHTLCANPCNTFFSDSG